MSYKLYKNEEVEAWTGAPKPFIHFSDLKESFENGERECLIVLDYIESIDKPELELQVRTCRLSNISGIDDYDGIVKMRVSKMLPEMKSKYDIYSDIYIKRFQNVSFFDISSIDLRWRLALSVGIPIFMQKFDGRIIKKPIELQPEWFREWKETGEIYDFSKNNL